MLQFENDMDCVILYVFLYLACFVVSTYVIFLSLLDYNGLYKFNNIYLQDYIRRSVAVSQRRNDHMQVHIIIMYGKQLFHMKWFNGG